MSREFHYEYIIFHRKHFFLNSESSVSPTFYFYFSSPKRFQLTCCFFFHCERSICLGSGLKLSSLTVMQIFIKMRNFFYRCSVPVFMFQGMMFFANYNGFTTFYFHDEDLWSLWSLPLSQIWKCYGLTIYFYEGLCTKGICFHQWNTNTKFNNWEHREARFKNYQNSSTMSSYILMQLQKKKTKTV